MKMPVIRRPTKQDLSEASGRKVPDIIDYNLSVLFCGINPGLYSAAMGHHFARPGNRFWPVLFEAGLTKRRYSPFEDWKLVETGYGITNVVDRASASADELSKEEFKNGGQNLKEKVLKYNPAFLAVLGIGAYRTAFNYPRAVTGLQTETIGKTKIFVLPNPSGLNAHYSQDDLVKIFTELYKLAVK